MNRINSDSHNGEGVAYVPKSGSYSKLIIWTHGLGDTADGWASLIPSLNLEDTKVILPTASIKPITLNGGYPMTAWFDIKSLEKLNNKEDREGLDASKDRLEKIIKNEIEQHNIQPENVILAGFSQGGALSLHTALKSSYNIGGCIVLSSWLPFTGDYSASTIPENKKESLKIFQAHGDADNIVLYEYGKESYEFLKTLGFKNKPKFYKINGMGHSSDPEELGLVKKFITENF